MRQTRRPVLACVLLVLFLSSPSFAAPKKGASVEGITEYHFDNGLRLPEGQEVTVLALEEVLSAPVEKSPAAHSILDIPPVSVGAVLRQLTSDDDVLGEMLEGRT